MATLTLGQMLEAALGSSRVGVIDFEQLYSLLNGMLLHLGLRDLPVQESGEPVEGAEESPFSASFLKELKQRVEANEKEIAEVRALCQELREEVDEVKLEQSYMAEDMQYILENFNMEEFQNMMDDFRNQLMESIMSAVKEMIQGPDKRKNAGPQLLDSEDDPELIVIGNEITLVERPKTARPGDSQPASPLPPDAKTQGRGKEENASSDLVSAGDNDMGQNRGRSGMGRRGMGWSMGQRDMRRNVQWSDAGQNDMGQEDMGRSDMGQRDMRRNIRWRNRGRNDMAQEDTGQDDMGQKDMGRKVAQKHMRRNVQWSDAGQNDMGQKDIEEKDMGQNDMGQDDMGRIKDEEIEIRISKAEALPSPLDSPPEMTNMGEIKEEDTKMSISKAEAVPSPLDSPSEMTSMGEIKEDTKAPPHVQKSSDGSSTTSGMHPRAPGTHIPVQQVQSVQGQPGSQNLWIPAESVAGTSSRFPTSKEAHGGGSLRMEAYPAEAGLMLLKVPSSEYSPCDQFVQLPGRHSEFIPATPPASPGFSIRLPHARRQEHREQAAEGYSRRSPMYSGGKHTSVSPVQPMEPLLPDPNKPGTFDLMGRDGVVYRGRTPPETD